MNPHSNPVNRLPRVWFTPEAKQAFDTYIAAAAGEISGLGRASKIGGDLLVTDLYMLEQICSPTETILDDEAVANFLVNEVIAGRDPSELRLWWHSHANMGVFWSSIDTSTIAKFSSDWMLSVVGNKNGDYLARLDIREPWEFTMNNLPISVDVPYDAELEQRIRAEVAEKLTVKTFVPQVRWKRKDGREGKAAGYPKLPAWNQAGGQWDDDDDFSWQPPYNPAIREDDDQYGYFG